MTRELVEIINERAGCGLEITGVTDQGQSGAAFVRWPDGRDSVVTTAFATLEQMRQTAEVLAGVCQLGIPVPEHEFLLDLADGRNAVVQEQLPGSTITAATTAHIDTMVATNDRFVDLLADRPDIATPPLSLGRPGDPTPTKLIESHGSRANRLLKAVRATAGDRGRDVIGDDLVHVDLTLANMLFDAGALTGVIDWNYGVARGDRHYGLVKLLHNLSFGAATADGSGATRLAAHVERIVTDRVDPRTLRRYWSHHTVNMMHASLRWGTEEAFIRYLELGESRLI